MNTLTHTIDTHTTFEDTPQKSANVVAKVAGFRIPAPVYAVLSLWLAAAFWIGDSGLLAVDASHQFRPIALSAMIPVGLFFAAYGLSPTFRAWTATIPVALLTGLQAWRVIGFSFLLLYAFNALPLPFAFFAGVGDVLVGLGAAFVAYRISQDPTQISGAGFRRVHIAGLVDFAVAVAAATLTSGAYPEIWSGPIFSDAMEVWPLNIFPSFGVPLFIILHAIALINARKYNQGNATVR